MGTMSNALVVLIPENGNYNVRIGVTNEISPAKLLAGGLSVDREILSGPCEIHD